jgi:hypothetical protein
VPFWAFCFYCSFSFVLKIIAGIAASGHRFTPPFVAKPPKLAGMSQPHDRRQHFFHRYSWKKLKVSDVF